MNDPVREDSGNLCNVPRAGDWGLQLFPMNEEFRVSASHELALITSLPFVHTARRYYRLNERVRISEEAEACRDSRPQALGLRRCSNSII